MQRNLQRWDCFLMPLIWFDSILWLTNHLLKTFLSLSVNAASFTSYSLDVCFFYSYCFASKQHKFTLPTWLQIISMFSSSALAVHLRISEYWCEQTNALDSASWLICTTWKLSEGSYIHINRLHIHIVSNSNYIF